MLLPLGLFFWVLTGYTVERKRQRTRARRARAHVRERERWGGGMGGREREKRQKKISKFCFFPLFARSLVRATQSIMYIPLEVNRLSKMILLIT